MDDPMYHCPCDEKPMTGLLRARPKLFNWITILLLTGWVLLVALVAELSTPVPPEGQGNDVETFIEQLL